MRTGAGKRPTLALPCPNATRTPLTCTSPATPVSTPNASLVPLGYGPCCAAGTATATGVIPGPLAMVASTNTWLIAPTPAAQTRPNAFTGTPLELWTYHSTSFTSDPEGISWVAQRVEDCSAV